MRKDVLLVITALLLFSCGPDQDPGKGTPDYTIQYDNIAGVDPNLLSLDIYTDGITGPAPVLIWIHGGGWAIGDKLNGTEFKENLCRDHNYILVSINYRLSSTGSGIQHPIHTQDAAKAIAWVYNNISSYGGDSSRIALMGHSAGAHIAALVCTDETYLQAEGLDLGIIDGCAAFDSEGFDIPYSMANGNEENEVYLNAFSSNSSLWANASPVYHIDPGKGIADHFILAKRGGATRTYICYEFRDSLTNIGCNVTVIDASSLSHEQVNDRIGAPDDNIMTAPVINFLQTVFN